MTRAYRETGAGRFGEERTLWETVKGGLPEMRYTYYVAIICCQ
jgi:hypothetical protein